MMSTARARAAVRDTCWILALAMVLGSVAWSLTLHLQARFDHKQLMNAYATEQATLDAHQREFEWLQATLEMARSADRATLEEARELGLRPPRQEQRVPVGEAHAGP